jgi:hypothetical protein
MSVQVLTTLDGTRLPIGDQYLATPLACDPAPLAVDLFATYLRSGPFSGYFTPSETGWYEERADECRVSILRHARGEHLLLVSWPTEQPHEVTARQMVQMRIAWDQLFPDAAPVVKDDLVAYAAESSVVDPADLGLAAENAGASTP